MVLTPKRDRRSVARQFRSKPHAAVPPGAPETARAAAAAPDYHVYSHA
jgi:hypothetical protein